MGVSSYGSVISAGKIAEYRDYIHKRKKKKCTHEHAIRGKCLKCGKEGV